MNYYEHHIRDYDAATSHLSWEEDLAYTRLLRLYYRKEQPIPADIKEACRLVRASTKAQRDAVGAVLKEFFDLREDGWHQETCDTAIAAFKAGEPERELKKANEENRVKRHREERAQLFKVLTAAGQHAPWNIGIAELREMVRRLSETPPETPKHPKTETPVTASATLATATQSPDTTPHTPVEEQSVLTAATGAPTVPATAGDWWRHFRDKHGLQLDPSSVHDRKKAWPIFTAWCNAKLSIERVDAAVATAQQQATEPIAFLPGYVDRVLSSQSVRVGNGAPIDNDAENAKAHALLFGQSSEVIDD